MTLDVILTKFYDFLEKIGIASANGKMVFLAIAVFVALLVVLVVVYFLFKLLMIPFHYRKFRYFVAMLIAIGDAVLFCFRLQEDPSAPLNTRYLLFGLPSLIGIGMCALYFICFWRSGISEVDKRNVMVVGTTDKTTKLSKSYFESALSGKLLGFSKSLLYTIETLAFFGIGLILGVFKTALVNALAREVSLKGDFTSEMLAKVSYIVVCAIAAMVALGRFAKKKKDKKI